MPTHPVYGEYKDRKTGLVIFGVVQILAGLFSFLMSVVIAFAMTLSTKTGTMSTKSMIPGIVFWILMGVVFIAIGVGSIQARRWARTLVVTTSWLWLVLGIVAIISLAFNFDAMQQQMNPQGKLTAGMVAMIGTIMATVLVLIYVLIPVGHILFYQSRHTTATCELRRPFICWTDKCPMPVLALVLIQGLTGVLLLMNAATGMPFGFFGVFLTGYSGIAISLTLAAIYLVVCWQTFKLRTAAWWTMAGVTLFLFGSWLTTLLIAGMGGLYEAMDIPADLAEKMATSNQRTVVIQSAIFPVLGIAYLIFVLVRYFNDETRERMAALGAVGSPAHWHKQGTCPGCGAELNSQSQVDIGGKLVCIDCKPTFEQRLREGLGDLPIQQ